MAEPDTVPPDDQLVDRHSRKAAEELALLHAPKRRRLGRHVVVELDQRPGEGGPRRQRRCEQLGFEMLDRQDRPADAAGHQGLRRVRCGTRESRRSMSAFLGTNTPSPNSLKGCVAYLCSTATIA